MRDSTLILLAAALALAGCSSTPNPTTPDRGAPRPDAGMGRLVSPVREFRCRADAITKLTTVAKVEGSDAEIAIKPDGVDCVYQLVYRSGQSEQVLSTQPSGYLIAAGSRVGDRTIVCASRIDHSPDPQGSAGARLINSVTVECAAHRAGSWGPLLTVVNAPSAEWAAWVVGAAPVADSASFELGYVRDFSFQFLNLANRGRPPTDGIYTTRFTLDSAVAIESSVQTSTEVTPAKLVKQEPWEPSAEQKSRFGKYMGFGEGSCAAPTGCPTP